MQRKRSRCVRLCQVANTIGLRLADVPCALLLAVIFSSTMMQACRDGNDLVCEDRLEMASEIIDSALSENLSCKTDADCTTVDTETGCGGSCGPVAVAKEGLNTVRDAVRQADQDYCDGFFEDGCSSPTPGCIGTSAPACSANGTCFMQTCYSPFEDVNIAYYAGAVGCSCDAEGKSICVGNTSLNCAKSANGTLAWIAVEDGVCQRPDRTCMDGTEVATAAQCLAMFDTCYATSSGPYCGLI